MSLLTTVHRNAGHPWDNRPGFDLLELTASTSAELIAALQAAQHKHWQVWIAGMCSTTLQVGAVLFKPCDVKTHWHDTPDQPHPGCIRPTFS